MGGQDHREVALHFGHVALHADWVMDVSINFVAPIERMGGPHLGMAEPLRPNVNLSIRPLEPPDATAAQVQKNQRIALSRELPKFHVLTEGILENTDGLSLPFLDYTFELPGNPRLRQIQATYVRDGEVHFLTATAPENVFERTEEALRRLLASYRPDLRPAK